MAWAKGSASVPNHLDRCPQLSLTLEQGEELFIGCPRQARGSRGPGKPNADSRT